MNVLLKIAAACLIVQVAFAAESPLSDPRCDEVCPETFPIEDNILLPYPGNCSKFCQCANNGNMGMDCPPGLYFNPLLDVCDHPYNVPDCDDSSEPSKPTDPSEPTDPTDPSKPTEPTDPSEPTDPTIPSGCEGTTCGKDECFDFANKNECQGYCNCNNGVITSKWCADGLEFNPITELCDLPENVNCNNGCSHVDCGEHECFKVPNTLDCEAFCDCDHGNLTVGHCSPGLHFNPETQTCDWPENAHCEVTPTPSVSPSTPEATTTSTEAPTTPSEAPTTPSETPSPSPTPSETPSPSPTPSETPTPIPTTTTKKPSNCDDLCPHVFPIEENNHIFPGDCTKFCHCANDGNHLKDCPPGLHFNQELEVCDWPYAANCVETE